MKTKYLSLIVIALATACRTAPTSSIEEERRHIHAAIEERERQFRYALEQGDGELLSRQYSWDAYLLRPDGPSLRKDDMLSFYQEYLKGKPAMTTTTDYVDVAGSLDMAYEVGSLVEEYDLPTARVRYHAKYLNVWKKVGGTWRIAAEADLYDTRIDTLYVLDPVARADSARQRAAAVDSARKPFRRGPDGTYTDTTK